MTNKLNHNRTRHCEERIRNEAIQYWLCLDCFANTLAMTNKEGNIL